MTDTDKLKRLAEAAAEYQRSNPNMTIACARYAGEFFALDHSEVILALIAENERLKVADDAVEVLAQKANHAIEEGFKHIKHAALMKTQRDEAVALLREIVRTGVEETCEHGDQREAMRRISLLVARIDAKGSE